MCPSYAHGEPCKSIITKKWCVFNHDQYTFNAFCHIVYCINNRTEIKDVNINDVLGINTRSIADFEKSQNRLKKYPRPPNIRQLKNVDKLLKIEKFNKF